MIVLCCPVEGRLWPATEASLAMYAPQALIIPIPGDDITRPWTDYAARWGGDDDLVVVEQDVVIHEDVLPGFDRCPEPWCLYPARHYARGGGFMDSGIMCNRFRVEFMRAVPVAAIEERLERRSGGSTAPVAPPRRTRKPRTDTAPAVSFVAADEPQPRQAAKAKNAAKAKCEHRLPVGAYCRTCDKIKQ